MALHPDHKKLAFCPLYVRGHVGFIDLICISKLFPFHRNTMKVNALVFVV